MSLARVAPILAGVVLASCGDPETPPAPTPPPAPASAQGVITTTIDGGITELPSFDPSAGHLDDDDLPPTTSSRRPVTRDRRTLEVVLRSTPLGATAAVDGVVIGRTPTYWEGEFTGREREFTFVLAGHAMARYRFVPTQSGIVHARLTKIELTPRDAGVPEIPQPAPAPNAPNAPAASRTTSAPRPTVPATVPTTTVPTGLPTTTPTPAVPSTTVPTPPTFAPPDAATGRGLPPPVVPGPVPTPTPGLGPTP
ncbi:MAG: hypothetical protein R2939_04290 [Kofleriaceae bacterium]